MTGEPVTQATEALRANSDALLRDLDALGTLEEQKRTLPPTDLRMLELAGRIEEIAQRLLAGSSNQRELAEEIVGAAALGAPAPTIDDTPRSIQSILADWRAAERSLAAAEPGFPAALEAQALVDTSRAAYRRASAAAIREQSAE
ncbi:MAG TPA: hypothetical protein VGQ85_08095 [Candidatus Limnocylindrales bacterium]|nr:hypothetical protein [Candidatus Limnocylindrales bacterium]